MTGKDIIDKVLITAKISLESHEKQKYAKDLKNILEAFSSLDEVNVKGVEPAFQPIEIKDRAREDTVEPSLTQKEALSNARNKKDGYFVGPRAI